ncbi:MAG: Crp/Fnr family transcriptional regulator [Candidatus Sumerlaeaceae bacterium]|nr:Crp/Fnr family transcriptional regulator [Candidatus Sumerlaeaceae bacterium]
MLARRPEPPDTHLREVFLFRNWALEDLARLASKGRFTLYKCGDIVFESGTDCDRLLVLMEGQIQLFREQPNGHKVTLHTVRAQALVACAALFLDQCYPASGMVASEMAEIFEYPGDDFLHLLERRPDLARKMISALAMRLSELADRIEAEHALLAPARLARWLSEQPSVAGVNNSRYVALNIPKRTLAEHLGIQPETLSRAIRALCEKGVITQQPGGFVILDSEHLLALASGHPSDK